MLTISPNISALINLLSAVAAALVASGAYLTTIFGAGPTASIVGTAGLVVSVVATINTFLHSVSAPTAGVLASQRH